MAIEIYENPETGLFDLRVTGSDEYDDLNDLTEQEAKDEADAISAGFGADIVYT